VQVRGDLRHKGIVAERKIQAIYSVGEKRTETCEIIGKTPELSHRRSFGGLIYE